MQCFCANKINRSIRHRFGRIFISFLIVAVLLSGGANCQPILDQIMLIAGTGAMSTVGANAANNIGDGGRATSATLFNPYAVWKDTMGVIYLSDFNNFRIRSVSPTTNIITTFAGNGQSISVADGGVFSSAGLTRPFQIYMTNQNIFVAEFAAYCVRHINLNTNTIKTVAGRVGVVSSTGDGGSATSSTLNFPAGVVLDSAKRLYFRKYWLQSSQD